MQGGEKVEQPAVYKEIECKYCKTAIKNPSRKQVYCLNNNKCKDAFWDEARIKGAKKSKGIHFGRISKSPRLKALFDILSDKAKHTTKELSQILTAMGFENYAIGTSVSEIRHNGYEIKCNFVETTTKGGRIYEYQMI